MRRAAAVAAPGIGNSDRRRVAAADPSTGVSVSKRCAKDPDSAVRATAAANLNCPKAVLDRFSCDENAHVRLVVAAHPNCEPATIAVLTHDSHFTVRQAASSNPHCPPRELLRLAVNDSNNDTDTMVRYVLSTNLSCPPEALRHLYQTYSVDSSATVYDDILDHVAANKSCPSDVLDVLSERLRQSVEVAANTSCPPDLLRRLYEMYRGQTYPVSRKILERLAVNESCPDDLREALTGRNGRRSPGAERQEAGAADSTDPGVRSVAADTSTDPKISVCGGPPPRPDTPPLAESRPLRRTELGRSYCESCG